MKMLFAIGLGIVGMMGAAEAATTITFGGVDVFDRHFPYTESGYVLTVQGYGVRKTSSAGGGPQPAVFILGADTSEGSGTSLAKFAKENGERFDLKTFDFLSSMEGIAIFPDDGTTMQLRGIRANATVQLFDLLPGMIGSQLSFGEGWTNLDRLEIEVVTPSAGYATFDNIVFEETIPAPGGLTLCGLGGLLAARPRRRG